MELYNVFVYGTLMSGLGNNRKLEPQDISGVEVSRLLGVGCTCQRFQMFAAGVPFVDPDVPHTRIQGEVWEVSIAILERLDKLEGHPDWYFRMPVDIELKTGIVKADMYANRIFKSFGMDAGGVLVESGNFRDVLTVEVPTYTCV